MAQRKRAKEKPIRREPHTERVVTRFSKEQMALIERYLRRHPRMSRSAFVRRCVMERLVGEMAHHRPSLFEDDTEEGSEAAE